MSYQQGSQPQWSSQQPQQPPTYGQPPYGQPQVGQQSQTGYGQPPFQQNQQQMYQQPPMMQPIPAAPKKRRGLWIALGIIAALVVFACIGVSTLALQSSNTGTVVQTSQSSSSNNTSSSSQDQHFKVGQVVKVGDTWNVTVNSAKTSKGQDFSTPKSGTIYLLIDVSLKNISASEQNVSSILMFTLRDSTGQEYTESITTFTKPPDGKVESGAPLRGTLAYEVPTGQHQFTFAFQSNIVSSGQTVWDVNI